MKEKRMDCMVNCLNYEEEADECIDNFFGFIDN